ncbi:Transcriptional activator ptaB [Penicillium taxi]|uniref:Transcriptional activator ptaB n=1 Tax=Penicillium taxi TaxID=168475 RepID=UPI002545A520|nr:Transcriptional activator ptaB [Penicillium taxi]KAJ5899335.1 Transcriptional activator ptaB [Penicillium taxi]
MMMAQPFPAHQGMPQHAMPPGHHPMAAQHPNAGHPGQGMVQQMHPGVSAPGGPQVSQAGPMMGGMPPGAGTAGPGGPMPNAHALSHLSPAQAHVYQPQAFSQNCKFPPAFLLFSFVGVYSLSYENMTRPGRGPTYCSDGIPPTPVIALRGHPLII